MRYHLILVLVVRRCWPGEGPSGSDECADMARCDGPSLLFTNPTPCSPSRRADRVVSRPRTGGRGRGGGQGARRHANKSLPARRQKSSATPRPAAPAPSPTRTERGRCLARLAPGPGCARCSARIVYAALPTLTSLRLVPSAHSLNTFNTHYGHARKPISQQLHTHVEGA